MGLKRIAIGQIYSSIKSGQVAKVAQIGLCWARFVELEQDELENWKACANYILGLAWNH